MVSPGLQAEFAEQGGLTLQQVEVVRRLLQEGRMTMHDVAEAHGIGASGATQLVDRLEHRGLATRIRDERDRRVQLVVPTNRARDLARRFSVGMGRAAVKFLAVLNDRELETYVELTERLARARQHDGHRHLVKASR
jgi:DNA-binding MarR family transcriptional regulator